MYRVDVELVKDDYEAYTLSSELFESMDEAREAFEEVSLRMLWKAGYLCSIANEMRRVTVEKGIYECDEQGEYLLDGFGFISDAVCCEVYSWNDYVRG